MKLILLDGGPASGKNTLGSLLVEELGKVENKVKLLDLDTYVEEINPTWIWESKQAEEKDQQKARENYIQDISEYLQKNYIVVAIGERFLTKEGTVNFINKLAIKCSTYLFHLSAPLSLRKERLHNRGPHSLIDLEKDQKDRDNIKKWPGYVFNNINSPVTDANNLMKLIQDGKGLIDVTDNLSVK